MNPEFRTVNIRIFRGLNLLEDARITDPGSFARLQNIYRKAPGVLASRPGSVVYSRGDAFQVTAPSDIVPPSANTNLHDSLTDILLDSTTADTLRSVQDTLRNAMLKGPIGIQPRILPRPVPSRSSSALNIPVRTIDSKISLIPIRVNSLHRMYTDYGSRRFLIGAFDFEGGQGDRLFYVDESTSTPVTKLMTFNEMTVGAGGEWSFIEWFRQDPSDSTAKYYAIGTNQVGKPFTIKLDTNYKPVATLLDVQATDGTNRYLYSVNSMCIYNGSVVYGGFNLATATAGDNEDKSNYVCFSNPGDPHDLAETSNTLLDIRVGDTPYEPVTKVVVNSVATDTAGIRGQLVVFTTKRVVTYDGLPPVSGDELNSTLYSVALGEVGCAAPKTVVQTPAGLMFLGTDGLVYIIPRYSNGGPLPCSRTVESVFKNLTLRQQKQCAAIYDDGHYKLSVPEVNTDAREFKDINALYPFITRNGNVNAVIPNIQYWLDVREPMDASQIDFGYVWTGPHTGMKHSCFVKGTGSEDYNVLWAGSAIDGTIFQAGIEGKASDPSPETVTTTVPLIYDIQTGQFDAGDIHIDKSVKSMQYGVNVSVALDVTSSILTSGEVPNSVAGVSFTDPFTPVGTVLDGNTTLGNLVLSPPNSFRFDSNHPGSPARGRTFMFSWYAAPTVPSVIKFSDLAFVFEIHKRRE